LRFEFARARVYSGQSSRIQLILSGQHLAFEFSFDLLGPPVVAFAAGEFACVSIQVGWCR
jgi:hypothetical protein